MCTDLHVVNVYFCFCFRHSFLPRRDLVNIVIRDRQTGKVQVASPEDDDSGSDFEVD